MGGLVRNRGDAAQDGFGLASAVLKIKPIRNPCVGAFTDSSLYGAEGVLIDRDSDLEGYDKHKIHSQAGSLITLMSKDQLDDIGDVQFSMGDWRTGASRRVFHATFAAEANARSATSHFLDRSQAQERQ